MVNLLREVAQVEDVNAEQAEEHERLRPLGGIAPERTEIFHEQPAHVWAKEMEAADNTFGEAEGEGAFRFPALTGAEPFPATEHAGAAVDGGCGVIEEAAHASERECAEEQDVAQQHEHEEGRGELRAVGTLEDAR